MMDRRRLALISSYALLLVSWPGFVIGCICPQQPPADVIASSHTIVFVGIVHSGELTGGNAKSANEQITIDQYGAYERVFTVSPLRWIKGDIELRYDLQIQTFGTQNCGVDFILGHAYLIYANTGHGRGISTDACDYTKEYIPDGKNEFEALRLSQTQTQRRAAELYLDAPAKFMQHNYKGARESWEAALKLDPSNQSVKKCLQDLDWVEAITNAANRQKSKAH